MARAPSFEVCPYCPADYDLAAREDRLAVIQHRETAGYGRFHRARESEPDWQGFNRPYLGKNRTNVAFEILKA
jgi:hypothetical protein